MGAKQVTKDTLIGEAMGDPAARKVIEKHFGGGCLSCPGIKVETLSFGAMMHNVDAEKLIKEINEELEG